MRSTCVEGLLRVHPSVRRSSRVALIFMASHWRSAHLHRPRTAKQAVVRLTPCSIVYATLARDSAQAPACGRPSQPRTMIARHQRPPLRIPSDPGLPPALCLVSRPALIGKGPVIAQMVCNSVLARRSASCRNSKKRQRRTTLLRIYRQPRWARRSESTLPTMKQQMTTKMDGMALLSHPHPRSDAIRLRQMRTTMPLPKHPPQSGCLWLGRSFRWRDSQSIALLEVAIFKHARSQLEWRRR